MSTSDLYRPVVDGGIEHAHYFDGRLLTAEALRLEQDGQRASLAAVGRAVGEGVAAGLDVTEAQGTEQGVVAVAVTAGLALAPDGSLIRLGLDTTVRLACADEPDAAFDGFKVCRPSSVSGDTATYILTVAPSSDLRGRAPFVGLQDSGVAASCASDRRLDGVEFRLRPFAIPGDVAIVGPRRRSELAHHCLGTRGFDSTQLDNPFGDRPEYGVVQQMRASGQIQADEVPLACLAWKAGGIDFIDTWSARRRISQPLEGAPWAPHLDPRRTAELEATFFQFQHQLDSLTGPNASTIQAAQHFEFLPAAGYLPVGELRFDLNTFFQDLEAGAPEPLDPGFARRILHQGLFTEPIRTTGEPKVPIRIFEAPTKDYVLFARIDRPKPPVVEEDSTPIEIPTGGILATVFFDPNQLGWSGWDDPYKWKLNLYFWATVTAVGLHGKSYTGVLEPRGFDLLSGRMDSAWIGTKEPYLVYRFRDLPPGSYTVTVNAEGAYAATQIVTVSAGETEPVTFRLKAKKKVVPKPPREFPGRWLDDRYDKVYILCHDPKWPWVDGPSGPGPDPAPPYYHLVENVPDHAVEWSTNWGIQLKNQYPDAPIDPGGARFYIDRSYKGGADAQNAPGYVTFGDNGTYFPLLMTGSNRTLPTNYGVKNLNFGGYRDDFLRGRLREVCIDSIDGLGGAWGGLIKDLFPDWEDPMVKDLLDKADEKVKDLMGSITLLEEMFGDDELARLGQLGQGLSLVDLANMNVGAIDAQVNDPGKSLTILNAARGLVPNETWDIGAADIGLSSEDIATLGNNGIETLGGLHGADSAALSGFLNMDEAGADALKNAAAFKVDAYSLEIAGGSNVIKVKGVDDAQAAALANIGLGTSGQLSNATPAEIHAGTGISVDQAETIIANARKHVGDSLVGGLKLDKDVLLDQASSSNYYGTGGLNGVYSNHTDTFGGISVRFAQPAAGDFNFNPNFNPNLPG